MTWLERLAELVEDWVHLIRLGGWGSALPQIGRELARLPYRRIRFLVLTRGLREPVADLQSKVPLQVREFGHSDLELVRQIDRPSEAKQCARRLARGHMGLMALCEGQPVGYAWCLDRVEPALEGMHVRLDPGDIYFTDAYVAPAYRRQGVYTVMTVVRIRLARRLGYRRMVTCVDEYNQPALTVWQRKLGVQVVTHLDFVRIGPWRCTH
jgi:GNAT superfamily N-acetyltransferase